MRPCVNRPPPGPPPPRPLPPVPTRPGAGGPDLAGCAAGGVAGGGAVNVGSGLNAVSLLFLDCLATLFPWSALSYVTTSVISAQLPLTYLAHA